MTLDVKLPRWLAWIIAVLWIVSLVEGIVATAINARANLFYMESEGRSPPPPYPGQPAMQREPEKDADKKKDDGEGKRKKMIPRKP